MIIYFVFIVTTLTDNINITYLSEIPGDAKKIQIILGNSLGGSEPSDIRSFTCSAPRCKTNSKKKTNTLAIALGVTIPLVVILIIIIIIVVIFILRYSKQKIKNFF